MSEENKNLSEELHSAVKELPESVQSALLNGWMNEAIGAKKVCDMTEKAEEKSARDAEAASKNP